MTDFKAAISKLIPDTPAAQISSLLRDVAKARLTAIEENDLLREINERIRKSKSDSRIRALGATLRDAKETLARAERAERQEEAASGKPLIAMSDGFQKPKGMAWEALHKANAEGMPFLFDLDGDLVRKRMGSAIEPLDYWKLSNELMQHVTFVAVNANDEFIDEHPDEKLVRSMLADEVKHVDVLRAVTAMPFFTRVDGEIVRVSAPGYHKASGFYLDPAPGLNIPDVPDAPTDDDLDDAWGLIADIFGEFPFDDDDDNDRENRAGKAHLLALILERYVRDLIAGPTPSYYVVKPKPGTGATWLVELATMIGSGRVSVTVPEVKGDENELRKTIHAHLLSGEPYFWVDNINGGVFSGVMASMTTAERVGDRRMGKNLTDIMSVNVTWILSGNNVELSGEIARRCVPIRLDAKVEHPEKRDFRIKNLKEYAGALRGELAWAALTMIQRWVADGAPDYSGRPLTSYESWSRVIGGILESAGYGDRFLGNLDIASASAESADDVARLLVAWASAEGDKRAEARPLNKVGRTDLRDLADGLGLDLGIYPGVDERAWYMRLAKLLRRYDHNILTIGEGETETRVCFRMALDKHTKVKTYWFEDAAGNAAGDLAA